MQTQNLFSSIKGRFVHAAVNHNLLNYSIQCDFYTSDRNILRACNGVCLICNLFGFSKLLLRKYSNPFKRPGMYPSISKCNAKRCNCCMHLCTNSTVTSSVNGRKFSVVNNSDLD